MVCLVQVGDKARVPAAVRGGDPRHGIPRAVLRLLQHGGRRTAPEGRRLRGEVPVCAAGGRR